MQWLSIDTELFLFINGHYTSFTDELMWHASQWYSWIPLYIYFIYNLYTTNTTTQLLRKVVVVLVCIALSDYVASGIIKHYVMRLRPSHEPMLLTQVHAVHAYVGGLYGFVSSHAANTIAMLICAILLLKKNNWLVLLCVVYVVLTGYSRIYLGVHYPLDIVGGWCVGIVVATLVIKLAHCKQWITTQ